MPYSISEEKIEEILSSTDIVDVIGECLTLKRAGANYTALCPFHKEKTPSFTVSPDKQIFHCFGCGESGDAIGFVMKYRNYDFLDSVEYLADKAGIKIERKNISEDSQRQKYYDINREAARHFFSNIKKNRDVQAYLFKRNIDKETIKKFAVGYSNDSWDDLLNYLKEKNYDPKDIEATGLIIKRKDDSGYYDRFRNRVIFPIFDNKDRVIGFGGRVLDNSMPKYLNSPETVLFRKGKQLYNLNNARRNLREGNIILAEGYMDVIKMSAHGFENAVASLGTALTEEQVKLIKKYTREFIIAYDSDNAGLDAALKASGIIKRNNFECRIMIFPEGMDPDEYLDKNGHQKFSELREKALSYTAFLDYYFSRKHNTKTDKGKISYIRDINLNLRNIRDNVEKELAFEKFSQRINVSKDSIIKEYNKKYNDFKSVSAAKNKKIITLKCPENDWELELINLVSSNNKALEYLKNNYCPDDFAKLNIYEKLEKIMKSDEMILEAEDSSFKIIPDAENYLELLITKLFLKNAEEKRRKIRKNLVQNPEDDELKLELVRNDIEIKSLKERSQING